MGGRWDHDSLDGISNCEFLQRVRRSEKEKSGFQGVLGPRRVEDHAGGEQEGAQSWKLSPRAVVIESTSLVEGLRGTEANTYFGFASVETALLQATSKRTTLSVNGRTLGGQGKPNRSQKTLVDSVVQLLQHFAF